MAEIAFERIGIALEATRGTAVTPPTHMLPLTGTIKPATTRYVPEEQRGHLAARPRSKVSRKWGEWEAEGGMDTYYMPLLANMVLAPLTVPTTPTNALTARLWTFLRVMTGNTLKSATMYWGDPGVQMWQGAFGLAKELEISADGTGEDGTTVTVSGITQFPTKVAAPTFPAEVIASLIVPLNIQVWLDTTLAMGTTEILARVLSVTHTIPSGLQEKFVPGGVAASRSYTRAGVAKSNASTTLVMELLDTAQYDLFQNETRVRLRVQHNGAFIENNMATDFYEYVAIDARGYLDFADWGDYEGTNRTIELTLEHEYDVGAGTDTVLRVQNTRTAL